MSAVAMAGRVEGAVEGYDHLYRPGEGEKTLVLLHGTAGDMQEMAALGQSLAGAALPGAAVLSLQGDVLEGGMPRFFSRRAEGVYDMADLARATAKLDGFLAKTLAVYGRDPAKAVGIGFSNGANILASLFFARPQALGSWALLHPLIPFEPEISPASGTRVLVTAGERDPICPPAATRALNAAIAGSGASLTERWYPGGHAPSQAEWADLAAWLAA